MLYFFVAMEAGWKWCGWKLSGGKWWAGNVLFFGGGGEKDDV